MTQAKQTTTAACRGRTRVSLIGFASTNNGAIQVRVPDATYLLSSDSWGSLHLRGRAWGTEISRVFVEDEMQANSVRWIVERGMVIIDDLSEGRKYCIREDDLMSIQPGQMIPVYGRDFAGWKYSQPVFKLVERVLPPVVA